MVQRYKGLYLLESLGFWVDGWERVMSLRRPQPRFAGPQGQPRRAGMEETQSPPRCGLHLGLHLHYHSGGHSHLAVAYDVVVLLCNDACPSVDEYNNRSEVKILQLNTHRACVNQQVKQIWHYFHATTLVISNIQQKSAIACAQLPKCPPLTSKHAQKSRIHSSTRQCVWGHVYTVVLTGGPRGVCCWSPCSSS
jgi:hypothetical protein